MKLRTAMVALVALVALVGFTLLTTGTASAQTRTATAQMNDDCAHAPTIDSLETCVQHAAAQGFINNQRVANSLLVKLDAAEKSLNNDQPNRAIGWLNFFIREVQSQSGKHIDPMHADHLVAHAQMVIQAIKNG